MSECDPTRCYCPDEDPMKSPSRIPKKKRRAMTHPEA